MPQILQQKPTSAPAPKSAADYQAEALAVLDKGSDQTQTTTAPAETGKAAVPEVKDAGGETGNSSEKADPSAVKPEEKKPPEEKKGEELPTNIRAAFEKLTAEKAEVRKAREALAADQKALQQAQQLMGAKSPMELLRARGFTWKDAVEEMTGIRPEGEEAPDEKPAPKKLTLEELDPEVAADLKAWKEERAVKQAQERRSAVKKSMEEFVQKAGKFELVQKLGAYDDALTFIESHYAKYRELPGSTPQESMEIALAHVEESLQEQAKKWRGVLTPGTERATHDGAGESPENAVRKAASELAGKTLSNSQAGASRTGTNKEPSTPEEFRAAALAAWKD